MKRTVLLLLAAGCVYAGKATREERLSTALAERDRYCDRDVEPLVADIRSDIHATEPLYVKLRTGPRNGNYAVKLVGAQLYVPDGHAMTPEQLQGILHCHQARTVLGDIPASADDPFSLADAWMDIQVQSERSGLVVKLRGQDPEEAQLIDSKAQRLWARSARGVEDGGAAQGGDQTGANEQ
jgi:hypothetical protein